MKKVVVLLGIVGLVVSCQPEPGYLEPPELILPEDGKTFQTTPPTFFWNSVTGADGYVLLILKAQTGDFVLQDSTTDTICVMSNTIFRSLDNTSYFWAVASLPTRDDLLWSDSRSFDKSTPGAPVLIAPPEGTSFDATPPVFVWHKDSLISSYVLRVLGPSSKVLLQDTLNDTLFQMPNEVFTNAQKATYQWLVGSLADTVIWSSKRNFKIDSLKASLLISPPDSTTFNNQAPAFIWNRDPAASKYVIRIVKGTFFTGVVIVEDTLTDTTYTMTDEDFMGSLNGNYTWGVACNNSKGGLTWRGLRTLRLNKPSIDIDLDTTYFPFGLNYSWTYENYHYHEEWIQPYPDSSFDTITVKVTDSLFGENGWSFVLDGSLIDIGDTAQLLGARVKVFDIEWLTLDPDVGNYKAGISVSYKGDTLNVIRNTSGHYLWDGYLDAYWSRGQVAKREKGLGILFAEDEYLDQFGYTGYIYNYNSSTLLYFCRDTDTIWRRKQ